MRRGEKRPQRLWKCYPSQLQRGAWFLITDQIMMCDIWKKSIDSFQSCDMHGALEGKTVGPHGGSHWTYCISTAQVGQTSIIQTNPHLMKNQDEQIKAFGLLWSIYSTTCCISVTWSSKDAARAPLWQGVHRWCVEYLTTLIPRWNHTKVHHYIYFWSRWAKGVS